MTRVDVADLVSHHCGKLRLVAEERQDSARDVDVAAGQRERVHGRLVDHREGPRQIRTVRRAHQPLADTFHVALQLRIAVDPHLLPYFGVGLPSQLNLVGLGHEDDLMAAGRRVRRATARDHNQNQGPYELHAVPPRNWVARAG
jgi:hypothetical protein